MGGLRSRPWPISWDEHHLARGAGRQETVRLAAHKLVPYHRRAGGQSQFSSLLELKPKSDRIQTVLTYARRNLAGRLSVGDLAQVAHLSPGQFSRAFQAETGQTPAKAVGSPPGGGPR